MGDSSANSAVELGRSTGKIAEVASLPPASCPVHAAVESVVKTAGETAETELGPSTGTVCHG